MIQEDNQLLMVLRYIEGNPVRARMISSATEWRWSSHNEVIGKEQRGLLEKLPIETAKQWTKYVDMLFEEAEIDRVRASVNRQTPFGDATWQMKKCKEFGLESTMKRRGRPKKESEA